VIVFIAPIRHSQVVHNKVTDFKMPDFRSTNDEAADRDDTHCKRSNRQRPERESSDTLRSDRQCAHAHGRKLIPFCLVHAAVNHRQP